MESSWRDLNIDVAIDIFIVKNNHALPLFYLRTQNRYAGPPKTV